jgi:hypothetical protein
VAPCFHSLGNAEVGGDDLLFLRGLPKSAMGTRLSGEAEFYEQSPTEAFRRVAGIPGVRIKISGPNGFTQETKTNGAGAYEIYGLRPGTYSVRIIEVPRGLKIRFPTVTGSAPVPGDNAGVQISADGDANVSFVLEADTRLSGRMLSAKGAPVAHVCLDLDPLEGRSENGASFFTCSKEKDGTFSMEMMPPGKYWLVAHDDISVGAFKSKSTLYYPGARDRQKAALVSVKAGDYLENLDIRLPAQEQRYKISGHLRFADGVGVDVATITFTSSEHGYSEVTGTEPDGSFRLPIIAGVAGELTGQIAVFESVLESCPDFKVEPRRRGMFRLMHTAPITLSINSDQAGISLKLPSPSCKAWPFGRKPVDERKSK